MKCLTPVYKKGGREQPSNYRPIATSNTMCRVLACVLSTRLTRCLEEQELLQPFQFGFRPQLSTHTAHMVITTCIDVALEAKAPAAVIKLDIAAAYDTVDRGKLWGEMRAHGLPADFIEVLQSMYEGAQYVVKANGAFSSPFPSNIGLLQGCALSPLLYNLYISRALADVERDMQHLGVRVHRIRCLQTNYADDMHAVVGDVQHTQVFMNCLVARLAQLQQQLSVPKCQIMPIGRVAPTSPVLFNMQVVQQMIILGLIYRHDGSLTDNIQHRISKAKSQSGLVLQNLARAGCEHDVRISRLLHTVNVGQTLLYGSQLWGYRQLKGTDPMKHVMQPTYSLIPRQALRQPASTAHWIVSMHMGLMPIQYWILRSFVRWWNTLLSIRDQNAIIDNCLSAQIDMLHRKKACWLKHWEATLRRVLPYYPVTEFLHRGEPIDEPACMTAVCTSYHNMLKNLGDPRDPNCQHRRIAVAFSMHTEELGVLPKYHSWQLSDHIKDCWMKFLCTNTDLPVHSMQDQVAYSSRFCSKCTNLAVADEHHVLLECTSIQGIRQLYSTNINFQATSLADFFAKNNQDTKVASFIKDALVAYRS
jgi:hypothetical protein